VLSAGDWRFVNMCCDIRRVVVFVENRECSVHIKTRTERRKEMEEGGRERGRK